MGVGVVVRDFTCGVIHSARRGLISVTQWMVVEAMAVLTTTILIGQLGLTNAILEGDSLELVQALRREERSWTKYGPILEETKELLHGCHSWEICHVR
jgi:hypothetical protein